MIRSNCTVPRRTDAANSNSFARTTCWAFFIGACLTEAAAAVDSKPIAAVDTYGLHTVDRTAVLGAAGLREGGVVPDRQQRQAIIHRIEQIRGVRKAALVVVTAPFPDASGQTVGRPIVYIGIQESSRPAVVFRPEPTGNVTLPKPIVDTYAEFERAFLQSVKANDFSEDDSNGYALMGNATARAVQRKFVPLADANYDRLVDVLRNSKNAEQRSMAATIIGYAGDRKRATRDLVLGTKDTSAEVRNNAVRALSVLLTYAQQHRELGIEVSTDWCLELIESLDWTDRNKAMAVLDAATSEWNPKVLSDLRRMSLPTLVEMARWHSAGHAMMAFQLVGRIAGLTDKEIFNAWDKGQREAVIERALQSRPE
jgi:hypothetical protein